MVANKNNEKAKRIYFNENVGIEINDYVNECECKNTFTVKLSLIL